MGAPRHVRGSCRDRAPLHPGRSSGAHLAALKEAGKDVDRLTIEDLAPIDEFHSRRRLATTELAKLLAPKPDAHVVDIGSGLGGPARYIASTYGCRVTGVDLTPTFVAVATELAASPSCPTGSPSGKARRWTCRSPTPPSISLVADVAINIADRPRYYRRSPASSSPAAGSPSRTWPRVPQAHRTIPLMWADTPATSFLRTPEETRALLEAAGSRSLSGRTRPPPHWPRRKPSRRASRPVRANAPRWASAWWSAPASRRRRATAAAGMARTASA